MESPKFKRIVGTAKAYWPRLEVVEGITVYAWQKSLGEYPLQLVELAIDSLSKTHKFPPSISDIHDRVHEMQNGLATTPEAAFAKLCKLARLKGYELGREKMLRKKGASKTARIGLLFWTEICHGETSKLGYVRKSFVDAWNSDESQSRVRESLPAPESLKQLDIGDARKHLALESSTKARQILQKQSGLGPGV